MSNSEVGSTEDQFATLMAPVVRWLIRDGMTHPEFSVLLKRLFYEQAVDEIKQQGGKQTDSAISLLTGMQRRDIALFRKASTNERVERKYQPISVPKQVIALWLSQGFPESLPFDAEEKTSFVSLVRSISNDKHPRSVLDELLRLKQVTEDDNTVSLTESVQVPDTSETESLTLVMENISDHISASMANMTTQPNTFLEQSVFADGLSESSVKQLVSLSSKQWKAVMESVLPTALALVENDNKTHDVTQNQRFRVGMYAFHEATVDD